MCELTVPFSSTGDWGHRNRGEDPCRDCKDARNEAARRRRQENGNENAKWNKLWHRYRIRPDEYMGLLIAQDSKCALCLNPFRDTYDVHLDHSHRCDHPDKGERSCRKCVRGILCKTCNIKLAVAEDYAWMAKAFMYLGRTM